MSDTSPVVALAADLRSEQDELMACLAELSPPQWTMPSAAAGWSIRDQVVHLAYFDGVTALAGRDPAAFLRLRAEAMGNLPRFVDRALAEHSGDGGAQLLRWWRAQREDMLGVLTALASSSNARLPWFGPDMSVRSKLTARLMETWAHGQDVIDALGRTRPATNRLRHIAHLGVSTLAHSFRTFGLEPPAETIHVRLRSPGGDEWSWGDAAAAQRVEGPAEDFCLVVTQRRHVEQTALTTRGAAARQWMQIAQAFAGPPGARPIRKLPAGTP